MICHVLSLKGKLGIPSTFPSEIICSPVAMSGRTKVVSSGTQTEPLGCAWPHPALPARLCQHHHRELGTGFTAGQLERTGIILLVVSIHFSGAWRASGILFTDYSFNPYLGFFCEQSPRLLFKVLYTNRPSHSSIFFHQHMSSVTPQVWRRASEKLLSN